MANTLTIDQSSAVLRAVIKQATGQFALGELDTAQLLTIGKKMVDRNAEPVMHAISQVISRTIFSARPYKRKFAELQRSPEAWGNIVRKITILESENDLQNNDYIPLDDGESVDQYKVSKPKALQLNFIGQQTYEIAKTIFDTQLNVAFNSEAEFGAFISSVFTYVYNKIEKIHEETARATVAGMIAGRVAEHNADDTDNVVHLLSEYNAYTGKQLTKAQALSEDNFGDFIKFVYAKIEDVSNRMTEYSTLFHKNMAEGMIIRHTPKECQKLLLYSPHFTQAKTRVISGTYHENLLSLPGAEMVNYWQSITTPESISVAKVVYIDDEGDTVEHEDVNVNNVFAVMFDVEALGYSPILERTKTSPYNAKGEYRNIFWKFNERHWIDYTENSVVFLLD